MKKPMRKYKIEHAVKKKNVFLDNGNYSKDGEFTTIYSNYTQAKNKQIKLQMLGYNCEVIRELSSRRFIIKRYKIPNKEE